MKSTFVVLISLITFSCYSQKTEKTYYDNSTKVKEIFQVDASGQKNGSYKKLWTDGTVEKTGFYKSGMKNGEWKTYDNKGRVFSIETFKDDKYNGPYKQWCTEGGIGSNGKYYLCNESVYLNGKIESEQTYHNATVKWKTIVKDGKCTVNFENGKLKEEWINITGEIVVGSYKSYLVDGRPEIETKNGKTYKYSSNGLADLGDPRYDSYGSLLTVEFDSAGYHFKYQYNESVKNNYLTSIVSINLTDKKENVIRFNKEGKSLNELGQTEEEVKKIQDEKNKKEEIKKLEQEKIEKHKSEQNYYTTSGDSALEANNINLAKEMYLKLDEQRINNYSNSTKINDRVRAIGFIENAMKSEQQKDYEGAIRYYKAAAFGYGVNDDYRGVNDEKFKAIVQKKIDALENKKK